MLQCRIAAVPDTAIATTREMTIDALAREAGLTARNIRAYQSRGLLPPPHLRARTGYYGEEHLARLRRIRELQAEGFNLRAIERLLEVSESGRSEARRFREELLGAFGFDGAERVISAEELASRFGGPLDDKLMARAEKVGALRRIREGRIEVLNPTLLRAAEELVELGIPLRHALAVGEAIAKHTAASSKEFVRLFVEDVLKPLEGRAGADAEEWVKARDALERLRPLAGDAVAAAFQQAMSSAVEREVERRAGTQSRGA
jgi:DNA-binding transcriptional MerR regulator